MSEEGGFGFPFGGDPEELMRGLREFAEQQAETVAEAQRGQRRKLVEAAHGEPARGDCADDLAQAPEVDSALRRKPGAYLEAAREVVLAPAERRQLEAFERRVSVPQEELSAGPKR